VIPVAFASLALWLVSALATLQLARAANRARPPEVQDDRLADAGIAVAFRDLEASQWLMMAGVVAASFVFAATEFSFLFSLLFWGAATVYFAAVYTRGAWATRIAECEVLGPPTSRSYAWLTMYRILNFLTTGAWITALVCLGTGLAHLLVV
jgi:hypothetical protein